jgi:alkylation response protein AidB-like acyl-CoA dehydrogenase
MAFFQTPPALGNPWLQDPILRSYFERVIPKDALAQMAPTLEEIGELAAGELFTRSIAERLDEPRLVQWDAWGNRIDQIEVSSIWKLAAQITAEKGVIATAYERKHAQYSRLHQFALVYLIDPSWHVYSCPLAMTDGAARTLLATGNAALIERALPRLTSRDPAKAWTSGQWMTERTGGSDVAISETVAKDAGNGQFRLYGTKWFTSATTSQMALTLARPEGNPPGGSGLALFYVETRDEAGKLNGIAINRLKDKLGTRMVPTAELTLDGALATAVTGTRDGIKQITPMLATTRTWNAVCAASGMRRGMALAHDYARRRVAFGAPLAQKPLHQDTLAFVEAEARAAFLLAFRTVELMGKEEAKTMTDEERELFRMIVPLAKLVTGKQGVQGASEILEAFGGAGYVEDTGLPRLLRDAQVLPIWEGTTNVLSLDVLRVLSRGGSVDPIEREVRRCVHNAPPSLRGAVEVATSAVAHAKAWVMETMGGGGPTAVEQGARRFAMTLGRAVELGLLIEHATWTEARGDVSHSAAARLFARAGVDAIVEGLGAEDVRALHAG